MAFRNVLRLVYETRTIRLHFVAHFILPIFLLCSIRPYCYPKTAVLGETLLLIRNYVKLKWNINGAMCAEMRLVVRFGQWRSNICKDGKNRKYLNTSHFILLQWDLPFAVIILILILSNCFFPYPISSLQFQCFLTCSFSKFRLFKFRSVPSHSAIHVMDKYLAAQI